MMIVANQSSARQLEIETKSDIDKRTAGCGSG